MSAFFDFEKVFDSTWKYRITRDMYNLNIKGRMSILIRNFLVHWVSLGNTISEGSVRSATLFIKMYNIIKVMNTGIEKSLFVDVFFHL